MLRLLAFLLTTVLPLQGFAIVGIAGIEVEGCVPRDLFDPENIEEFMGIVKEVEYVECDSGMGKHVVLLLTAADGDIYVALSPDWYLENQQMTLNEDDVITVKGSYIENYWEKPVIIAQEIEKDGNSLQFRNASGQPEWSQWRRGEALFYKNYRDK